MDTTYSVTVTAFDRAGNYLAGLEAALASLDGQQNILISQALFKSALELEGKAKELAPVRTGTLRRSITKAINGNTAIVGTNLHYTRISSSGRRTTAHPRSPT